MTLAYGKNAQAVLLHRFMKVASQPANYLSSTQKRKHLFWFEGWTKSRIALNRCWLR
jgi:hypothetical protein